MMVEYILKGKKNKNKIDFENVSLILKERNICN